MPYLRRIVIHWTAGPYLPNETDKLHYHYMVDGTAKVHQGKFKPEANIPPKGGLRGGSYAAHTGGGNSYSIGVAICGMAGYSSQSTLGPYPLKKKQCEHVWSLCAELCKKYNIDVTPETVLTHYEFGKQNPNTSSRGKIDISFLPFLPDLKDYEVGDYIRQKVAWYLKELHDASNDKSG